MRQEYRMATHLHGYGELEPGVESVDGAGATHVVGTSGTRYEYHGRRAKTQEW